MPSSKKFVIFAPDKDRALARNISQTLDIPLGELHIKRINGSEIFVDVVSHITYKNVFLIYTTTQPINESLMQLLQIIDTLKKKNVNHINLIIPYLPYTKSPIDLKYITNTNLLSRLLDLVDVSSIYTFDLYSPLIASVFKIPVFNISILKIFSKVLDENFMDKDVVVTTIDYELQKRSQDIASYINGSFVVSESIYKNNKKEYTIKENINNKDILLVSNNIDTAKTIVDFASFLAFKGARNIYLLATHGLFSNDAIELIENSVIKETFVATSPKQNISSKIKVVSKQQIICEILERVIDKKNIKRYIN
jgi:ribose-phosphate pyrophosphokinase